MTASYRALSSATVRVLFAATMWGLGLQARTLAAQVPQDSTRARLKERIRATSPALESRRVALGTAQARRMAAGLSAPAVLSAEVEEVPGVANVLRAQALRVDIGRELLPRARRSAERAIAESDVERARIELEVATAATDLLTDQLVVRAGGAAAIAARLASEDSLLRGAEEALRARFAVADARYVDVLRLRTERLRVETERHRARADYKVARGQLVRLARVDTSMTELVDASIALEASLALSGAAPPRGLDSAAALSGALRLAALDVQRAEATRRLVRSELRPVMSPSVGVQRFGEAGSSSSIGLTAGISISLPFTARRATGARSTVADHEVVLARAQQLATQASLATALATAHDRYEAAREQIASFDAALLRGARDEREAALAAYRTGGMTLLELLDFERALAQAEVSRIRSRVEAAEALKQYLAAALGLENIGGAS
jgi:cobalt-zinc-cadmium efflux system outer membrane protein